MFRTAFRSSFRSLNRTTLLSRASLTPNASSTPSRLTQLQLQHQSHRLISDDVRSKLQAAVKANPVVLFMKGTPAEPQCGFSRAVVQILDLHGVPPEKMQTYNVLEDPELRSGIKEFSEWPTVPQIYVNGEFIGGCDILIGMHQSGELETLLENNGVIPKIEDDASSSSSTTPKEEKAAA